MSLDFYLEEVRLCDVFDANITHNCNSMAETAGIFQHLWCPEELGITKASDLIDPLTKGIARLKADPARFEALVPPNGWGSYSGFLEFVEACRDACIEHPNATVRVSR